MRGFLIFLAIACPIALASPTFWWLVESKTGAAPVTYGRHDGTTQQALLGPKAPWPEWASLPEGSKLTVRGWFGPTGTDPETGYGDFSFSRSEPLSMVAVYRKRLEAEGWHVEANRFSSVLPEIPPQRWETCVVRATRAGADTRMIQASFELAPNPDGGSIHWASSPMRTWSMPLGEPC